MSINNSIDSQIVTNMQTHYASLIKGGATSIGQDSLSISIFNSIDKDKNGKLAQDEINTAMPRFSQIIQDAAAGAKEFAVKMFGSSKTTQTSEASQFIAQNQDTTFNGKIDNDFKQGETGDCWLLAAIAAMADTPEGQEKLNQMLSIDENDNITINLNNVRKITVSKEELESNDKLASGDLDVRALEYAFIEYMGDSYNKLVDIFVDENKAESLKKDNPIEGGSVEAAFNILMGGNAISTSVDDELIQTIKEKDHYVVVGTSDEKFVYQRAFDENNNIVKLFNNHAYAAIDADDRYVYLKNPHDTSQTIKITHDDFKSAFKDAGLRDKYSGMELVQLDPIQETELPLIFLE